MRKTLALFLTVFIIALSLYTCVSASVNSEKENVTIHENYIYGDKRFAEKVEVNFKAQYYDNLLWDINYNIAENKAETKFSLYRDGIPNEYDATNYLTLTGGFWNYSTSGFLGEESFFSEAFKDLVKDAKPYEEVKKTISVSDYLDYYPLSVEINFPNKYSLDSSLGYYETDSYNLVSALSDFFKIPVLKNHLLTISATVNESGNIFQSGSESVASAEENSIYDEFSIYGSSVITEDKCLIYFSNKSYMGKNVDTSKIPGGYGIYCLPYSYTEEGRRVTFDYSALSNVFSVESNHEITQLKLSADGKSVYMVTEENEECYLTVIDTENYAVLQKIKVSTNKNQSAGFGYIENSFAVINLYHENLQSRFNLYTIDNNGLFVKEFTALTHHEDKIDGSENIRYPGSDIYEHSNIDVEWDGENLYVTNDFDESVGMVRDRNAGFSLSVYNKYGLQFFGNYYTSLTSGYDGMYGSSYYVMLSRNDKIDITLK
ncbi:MAG: hypothetical protein IJB74_01815 [Clostridia bacterium]|nr:hypothetical protein [Clostridia bacterium]